MSFQYAPSISSSPERSTYSTGRLSGCETGAAMGLLSMSSAVLVLSNFCCTIFLVSVQFTFAEFSMEIFFLDIVIFMLLVALSMEPDLLIPDEEIISTPLPGLFNVPFANQS